MTTLNKIQATLKKIVSLLKKRDSIIFITVTIIALLFRMIAVSHNPPSLHWDEVSIGYDAYSVLTTGQDHHGNTPPLVAFESYGDYKPTLYFYVVMPFIYFFGLNTFALRLPSVLAGIAITIAVYFIAKRHIFITNTEKKQNWWSLISMLLLALSPWDIFYSRAAWESHLATAFFVWGNFLALEAIKKKKFLPFYWCELLFILSVYTYHSYRLTAPLQGVILFIFFIKTIIKKTEFRKKPTRLLLPLLNLIIIASLTLPIIISFTDTKVQSRFSTTTIMNDLEMIKKSNRKRAAANFSWWSRIIYHRHIYNFLAAFKHFITHFHPGYLFIHGDGNPRYSTKKFGQLYHIDAIVLLIGLFIILKTSIKGIIPVFTKTKKPEKKLNQATKHLHSNVYPILIFWIITAIIPASLVRSVPNALRTLGSMPAFILIVGIGLKYCLECFGQNVKTKIAMIIAGLYLIEVLIFSYIFFKIYPKKYSFNWQYGYKEAMTTVQSLKNQYPNKQVYISRKMGRPAMYYWFYNKTNPKLVQKSEETAKKDQSEFLEFDNITFFNDSSQIQCPSIFAITNSEKDRIPNICSDYQKQLVKTVHLKSGQPIWYIYVIE